MAHKVTPEEKAEFKAKLRIYKDAMKSGAWKNLPYNEFLDLVTERPDPSLDKNKPQCPVPSCGSTHVVNHGGNQTCVGGPPGYDPNHHWDDMHCKECGYMWTMEYKGIHSKTQKYLYNVWYTKEHNKQQIIVKGIPSCFESYTYHCRHCSGEVKRHYFDKGTRNKCTILTTMGDGTRCYDTIYICENCHQERWSTTDYYSDESPHKPRKPHRHYLRANWVIKEEIGIAVINDYAISQIELA